MPSAGLVNIFGSGPSFFLTLCCFVVGEALKPGMVQLCNNVMGDLNSRGLYNQLQVLLVKGLARAKPSFKPTSLSAIITLALRPLLAANFSDNLLSLFLLHIMSVPAVVLHVNSMAQEVRRSCLFMPRGSPRCI